MLGTHPAVWAFNAIRHTAAAIVHSIFAAFMMGDPVANFITPVTLYRETGRARHLAKDQRIARVKRLTEKLKAEDTNKRLSESGTYKPDTAAMKDDMRVTTNVRV